MPADKVKPPPLAGIRVAELGNWIQGPLAAQLLGDLGAEVIKIERPAGGDFSRGLYALYGVPMPGDDNGGLMWQLCNRNKRSVALNLKREEGRKLLRQLIRSADIFVTNLQPSELDSLGASCEILRAENPRLIYALGAGLAPNGQLANIPTQDTTGMAFSGLMYATSSEADVPYYPPGAMVDIMAAGSLTTAVLAALQQRHQTDTGSFVTTSLLHSALWVQMLNVGAIVNVGQSMPPFDRANAGNPIMNLYRCADGKWLAFGMLMANHANWTSICEILGAPELAQDDRFKSNRQRNENRLELIPILEELIARQPRDAILEAMSAAGLPCTPIHTPAEALNAPGVPEQDLLSETTQGVRFLRPPMNIRGAAASTSHSPALGEGTFDVLQAIGLDPEAISLLREDGIVF